MALFVSSEAEGGAGGYRSGSLLSLHHIITTRTSTTRIIIQLRTVLRTLPMWLLTHRYRWRRYLQPRSEHPKCGSSNTCTPAWRCAVAAVSEAGFSHAAAALLWSG